MQTNNILLEKADTNIIWRKDSVLVAFNIYIPSEFLSDKWSLTLSPFLVSNNSSLALKEVVFKGQDFADMQKRDYEKYNDYLSSIVDKSSYDSLFRDQTNIMHSMNERQEMFWRLNKEEWNKQIEFERWKAEQDGAQLAFIPGRVTYREQLQKQYATRIAVQTERYLQAGLDTVGLTARYMKEFNKQASQLPRFVLINNMPLKKVPKKYKEIYDSGRTLDKMTSRVMELLAENDSLLISYRLDDIIENEKRRFRKDSIINNLVPYQYNAKALVDSVIDPSKPIKYRYSLYYPAHKIKGLRVALSGKIQAIDRSGFTLSRVDTLYYEISLPNINVAK